MGFNSCETSVGRLLEIRVVAGYNTAADVDQMIAMIRAKMERIPDTSRAVIAADWRRCRLMSPEAAARAHVMLTMANPRIERSAVLVANDSPTAVMQFVRLVRESGHPERRIFSEATGMAAWLSEVLSPSEVDQLHYFLARQ